MFSCNVNMSNEFGVNKCIVKTIIQAKCFVLKILLLLTVQLFVIYHFYSSFYQIC